MGWCRNGLYGENEKAEKGFSAFYKNIICG